MAAGSILVADDDTAIRTVLNQALSRAGYEVRLTGNAATLWRWVSQGEGDLVITDVVMPDENGLDLVPRIRKLRPELRVIVMSAQNTLLTAVKATERGAFEYLPKPFDLDDALALVRRALAEAHQGSATAPAPAPASAALQETGIIGKAPAMQDVFRAIGRLSQSHITVLIHGESGTGKELVARALHRHSPRAHQPFIALNMAAIPPDLIESELFGHEKGAFTGATIQRPGRFEQADGGTLFLDEIGDMPLEAQTRLLRVLADGSFYRVGGHSVVQVDVRIIAATHQNLEGLVRQGRFREDLFHRLNVIRIHLPKLSGRREDIPQLAALFLQRTARELNVEPRVLLPETEQYIGQLDWPGNVRELENVCRWLTVMAPSREVQVSDLPRELLASKPGAEGTADWELALARWVTQALQQGERDLLERALPAFERVMLDVALRHTAGRRRDAAELLGWGRNTLTRKIRELGMDQHAAGDGDEN